MSLKVIGAGYGRTGTLSVFTALNQLGFPCYHMSEVLKNKRNKSHLDFWVRVANTPPGTQHDWEQVFGSYAAAVDNPSCCVWRELADAYPDAKVLLTVHPKGPEAWYASTMETIYFTETMWQFKVLEWTTPFGRKYADMSRKLIWGRSHKGSMDDRKKAIATYLAHIEEVKASVPPERLLVYSATEGWDPLCKFLGVPVPSTPFPNVNDRASLQKELGDMARVVYMILAAGGTLLAGSAYQLAHLLR